MILHNKKGILYLAILCSIIGTLFIYHNYKGQIKFFFHKPDLIHWTKDVTLTLSDFTGEINQNSKVSSQRIDGKNPFPKRPN